MTRLVAGRSGYLIPTGAREFLFSEVSRQVLRPTQAHIQWVPGFFKWSEAGVFEVDHHLI